MRNSLDADSGCKIPFMLIQEAEFPYADSRQHASPLKNYFACRAFFFASLAANLFSWRFHCFSKYETMIARVSSVSTISLFIYN